MAKPTKRGRTTKRKAAAPRASRLALSGWLVAAGLGVVWAAPLLQPWLAKVEAPDWGAISRVVVSKPVAPDRADRNEARSSKTVASSSRSAGSVERTASIDGIPETRPKREPKPKASSATPISPRVDVPSARPSAPIPNQPAMEARSAIKPVSVPTRRSAADNASGSATTAATAAGGSLTIRKFPFTTAETIEVVSDSRRLRVLGGQGDWKKVELSPSGRIGWLHLKRVDAMATSTARAEKAARPLEGSRPPMPSAALLSEAKSLSPR